MGIRLNTDSNRTLSASSAAIPTLRGQPALIALSLRGSEGVNSLFDYRLVLKTPDSLKHLIGDTVNFDTDAWRGQQISVQIQLDRGEVREINGIIDEAVFLHQEDRFAFYELRIRPWLHQATLTSDCRIFQNRNVKDIIAQVLEPYLHQVQWRLRDPYPVRDTTTQFNESNFAFLSRLCETWGISYFFEHSEGQHRLVLTDHMNGFRPHVSEAYHTVPFQAHKARTERESVHHFVAARRLSTGSYATNDYDYTRPRANLSVVREQPDGDQNNAVYAWHHPDSSHSHYVQPRAGAAHDASVPLEEGDFLARIRLAQLHCQGLRAQGSGPLKGMAAGHRFTLSEHPRQACNIDYLLLHTTLTITEVDQVSQGSGLSGQQTHSVHVEFEVYPWRGAGDYRPDINTPVPHMYGLESAVVVGPHQPSTADQPDSVNPDIWTDQLGRIKVQFHWDRLGQRDQNSSCWIRVSSPWAGNQLGAVHIPRVGQEVLVAFISGNPDLPVCHGRVFNQDNLPPWTLPTQAALSGFRSRELCNNGGNAAGGRSNHLLMDDSAGKLQAQLKSDHLHSQLSLGHVTRVDSHEGRQDERGQGFELRTDGHGAIRAKNGLLLSAEARDKAAHHLSDIDETCQRLDDAHALLTQLSGNAQAHRAQRQDNDQSAVADAIAAQHQEIGGNGEPHSELSAPHLVLASPAGIASSTPNSTHLASGGHTQITSGQHVSMTAGGGWFASVVDQFAVFVQRCGMKLIAAAGKISIQAQRDEMELIADKVLQLISQSDWVEIRGKKGVRLHGGNSMLEISDATQFFTPLPVLMHGGLETLVPQSRPPQAANPMREPNEDQTGFVLQSHGDHGRRYTREPVQLFNGDQLVATRVTGNGGELRLPLPGSTTQYSIRFADGRAYPITPEKALDGGKKLANQGWRDHAVSHKTSS